MEQSSDDADAWLRLHEAVKSDVADLDVAEARLPMDWSWFGWNPQDAGYLASPIRFTCALLKGRGWIQEDFLIWKPGMVGSICFLAASYPVLVKVSGGAGGCSSRGRCPGGGDTQPDRPGGLPGVSLLCLFSAAARVRLGVECEPLDLRRCGVFLRRWLSNDSGAIRCQRAGSRQGASNRGAQLTSHPSST